MRSYTLLKAAEQNLEEIGRYTFKEWGASQRDEYLRKIVDRFSDLAENPYLGRARNEIKPGYFSYPEGSHLIFYTIRKNTIEILAVLHEKMDVRINLL